MAPGEIAARIDRLPSTFVQWRYCLLTQLAYGFVTVCGSYAASLYPYVWSSDFSHYKYSWLNAVQVGIGILIGEYVGGYLADWFGRRKVITLGCLLSGLFVVAAAFVAPNYFGLMLVIFGQAVGAGFVIATNALYMHEIVPPKYRNRITLGAQSTTAIWAMVGFGLGHFLVPDHYRLYLVILGAATVVSAALLLTIPESPRWLEAKGRRNEARTIVERIEKAVARRAGRLPEPDERAMLERPVAVTERVPVREVFQGEYLRRTLLLLPAWILGYSGIVWGWAAYQAIHLEAYGFGASQFFLVSMITYGPGYALGGVVFSFFNERFERRTLVLLGAVVFSLAFVIIWYFSYVHQVDTMLYIGWGLIGTGSALWLFNMYNYTAAAYPTRLRSTATGITDGLGHVGAIFGPLVVVALGDATKSGGYYGFMLYCAIVGAIIPGVLIRMLGIRQKDASLEGISA
ncbi:MFS transporter [Actinomadura nitritigenes]|uniref:MFS transporter n=1 Tax=Actinomadura nitritigenes TaxID=134602 RepID=UPI003D9479A0